MLKKLTCLSILFWILLLPHLALTQNYEICGDGIDNDNDGQIDEVCQPFVCDGTLYQSSVASGDFCLYKVTVNPIQFTLIANLSQNGVIGSFNSLAYNPVDNLMYGMDISTSKIYRVDASGDVEFLGNVAGLSYGKNGGTFDANGNYYVYGSDQILIKINLNTLTYTTIGSNNNYGSADIVYNAVDEQIYGWSGSPRLLFKIDPNTGAQTIIPGNAPLAINGSWGWTGALYFNAQGDILGYVNSTMFKVNPSTGIGTTIGSGPSMGGNNDGCSCSFGVEMTKAVSGTFAAGDTITYTFEFFNQSFYNINNTLAFDDVLTNGFTWVSDPYAMTNLQLSGNTNLIGSSNANFTLDGLPKGKSSFKIDAVIPCDYTFNSYTNQATLSNLPTPLKDTIWSDNPNTVTINDATTFQLSTPPLNLSTTTTNIICDRTTGTIQLNVSGGSQPLNYLWSNGQTDLLATGLAVGNYTVTITGSTGCSSSISDNIIEQQVTLQTDFSSQNVQCNGEANGSIQINNTINGTAPYRYSLDGISYYNNTLFDGLSKGTYTLYIKDSFGCAEQQTIILTEPVFRLKIVAPNDTAVAIGDIVVGAVQQNTITHVEYEWTPNIGLSCNNCQIPLIKAPQTTTYNIKGMDIQGCYDSTTFTIEVNENTRVFIPNAFSPNGDGNNDLLMIYSPGDVQQVLSFRIFDRWGELVFEQQNFPANSTTHGWDGTFRGEALNSGVFIFAAELLLINGRTEWVTGDVSLLR